MDVLCGFHAKDPETCRWVIENSKNYEDNITVTRWVQACKDYLQSLSDGPDLVSTEQ